MAPTALEQQLSGTGISTTAFDVGGFRFDALVAGPVDGRPVMLLHGFPSAGYQWRSQMVALADVGYRVIAPDQRGYSPGARPPDIADYSMDLLVEDVFGIADAAGFEKFHLVGHDWGAAVAWAAAIADPDRLVTLNPVSVPHPAAFATALSDPEDDQSEMSGYMASFVQPGFEDVMLAGDAGGLRSIYESAGLDEAEMAPYLEVLGTSEALGAALNWYRAAAFAGGRDAPAVVVPTLFVWSDQDCCLGRTGAEQTVDFVDAPYRFEILEGVDHWVPETAADALNALLLDHLAAYPREDG